MQGGLDGGLQRARGVRGDNSRKGRGPAGSSGLGYRERQCNNAGVGEAGAAGVGRGDSEYLHGSGESDCRRTTTERERLSSNIAIVLNCARMAQRALIVQT